MDKEGPLKIRPVAYSTESAVSSKAMDIRKSGEPSDKETSGITPRDSSFHQSLESREDSDEYGEARDKKKKKQSSRRDDRRFRKRLEVGGEDSFTGWLKMRGTLVKNWHLRWCALRRGKIFLYRGVNKDFQGVILLTGVEVDVRASKKEGYCFKIIHPLKRNIYSTRSKQEGTKDKGLGSNDYCILRVNTQKERSDWMKAIIEATSYTETDPEASKLMEEEAERMNPDEMTEEEMSEESDGVEDEVVVPSKRPQTVYIEMEKENNAIYTSGLSNEEEMGQDGKALMMSLLKQVKIGMDLSRVVLPTFILEPRSMLEKLADFMSHTELLISVPNMSDPLIRMIGMVKWYLSGFYIRPKGVKKPYNPVLGEYFRASWQDRNTPSKIFAVAEQVSHHPPVSAFYASNRRDGFIIMGTILFRSKFMGTSAGSILDGSVSVYLLSTGEVYDITFPSVFAKGFLFGTLLMELVGNVEVVCRKSGLRAMLEFKQKPMFGGDYNAVSGKILREKEVLRTIGGKWDTKIDITDPVTKHMEVLWEPSVEVQKSRIPKYTPSDEYKTHQESSVLWQKVTEAILTGDQVKATEEKSAVESAQRLAARQREAEGITYNPKFFTKDDHGYWTYKYINTRPWDPETETEEYETDGVIRSDTLEADGAFSESDNEEPQSQVPLVRPVRDAPSERGRREEEGSPSVAKKKPMPPQLMNQIKSRSNSNTKEEQRLEKSPLEATRIKKTASTLAHPATSSSIDSDVVKRVEGLEKRLAYLEMQAARPVDKPQKEFTPLHLTFIFLFFCLILVQWYK